VRKVIDLECDLPPDETGKPRKFGTATLMPGFGDPERMEQLPGYGFPNYERIFPHRSAGAPEPKGMALSDFVKLMDEAGVETGVVGRVPNTVLGEILRAHPGRFIGMATISPAYANSSG